MESKRPYDFLLDIKKEKGLDLHYEIACVEESYSKSPYEDHSNRIRKIYECFLIKLAENHCDYKLVKDESGKINYTSTWYRFCNFFDFSSIGLDFNVDFKFLHEGSHYSNKEHERSHSEIRNWNISMLYDVYSLAKAYYSILTGIKKKFVDYILPEPIEYEDKIKIVEKEVEKIIEKTVFVEQKVPDEYSKNELKRLEIKYNREYNNLHEGFDRLKQEYIKLYKNYLKFQRSYLFLEEKCNKLIDENRLLKIDKQKTTVENDYKTLILWARNFMQSKGCFATTNTIFRYLKGIHSVQSNCFNLSSYKYWGIYSNDDNFTNQMVSEILPKPDFNIKN